MISFFKQSFVKNKFLYLFHGISNKIIYFLLYYYFTETLVINIHIAVSVCYLTSYLYFLKFVVSKTFKIKINFNSLSKIILISILFIIFNNLLTYLILEIFEIHHLIVQLFVVALSSMMNYVLLNRISLSYQKNFNKN